MKVPRGPGPLVILQGLHHVQQPIVARGTGARLRPRNLRFGPPEPPNSLTITGSFAAAFSILAIQTLTLWPLLL